MKLSRDLIDEKKINNPNQAQSMKVIKKQF